MAGLPWIKLDADIRSHPKMLHLAALLDDDAGHALAAVVGLWMWAARAAPTGIVRGPIAGRVIEQGAGWGGEAGRLCRALVEARWLDAIRDGYAIHDWDQHQGAHADKLARDRARWRNRTDRSRGGHAEVTRDSSVTPRVRGEGEERRREEAEPASPAPKQIEISETVQHARSGTEKRQGPGATRNESFELVSYWRERWQKAIGSSAVVTDADFGQAKRLLKLLPVAELRERVDRALAARWWLERGGNFRRFASDVDVFARAKSNVAGPPLREVIGEDEHGNTLFAEGRNGG